MKMGITLLVLFLGTIRISRTLGRCVEKNTPLKVQDSVIPSSFALAANMPPPAGALILLFYRVHGLTPEASWISPPAGADKCAVVVHDFSHAIDNRAKRGLRLSPTGY